MNLKKKNLKLKKNKKKKSRKLTQILQFKLLLRKKTGLKGLFKRHININKRKTVPFGTMKDRGRQCSKLIRIDGWWFDL